VRDKVQDSLCQIIAICRVNLSGRGAPVAQVNQVICQTTKTVLRWWHNNILTLPVLLWFHYRFIVVAQVGYGTFVAAGVFVDADALSIWTCTSTGSCI
jgi:hypothetical protein